jgi:hypothetical protein
LRSLQAKDQRKKQRQTSRTRQLDTGTEFVVGENVCEPLADRGETWKSRGSNRSGLRHNPAALLA